MLLLNVHLHGLDTWTNISNNLRTIKTIQTIKNYNLSPTKNLHDLSVLHSTFWLFLACVEKDYEIKTHICGNLISTYIVIQQSQWR